MAFKLNKEANPVVTENEYLSLFSYKEIDLKDVLIDKDDIETVEDAIAVIEEFLDDLYTNNLIMIEEE